MAKFKLGLVITTTGTKTISVLTQVTMYNKKYQKFWIKNIKLLAHDIFNEAKINDIVLLQQSRPWSRLKHWVLQHILTK